MSTPEWTLFVRNPALEREAQIDDYQKFEAIPRFNAVGSWILDIDVRVGGGDIASKLIVPQYGIEAVRNGTTVFSGPMRYKQRNRDGDTNRLTVSGPDDMVWLQDRLASPQPGSANPPYSTTAYDVRTGTCSTILRQYVDVNAGPGAVAVRQVGGLTLGTDLGIGTSVTGRARWQSLLELLQQLAISGGNLGFQLRHTGSGIEFNVYMPADKSAAVKFSEELGNLSSYNYETTAPETNYAYVGGGGEGTARTIREGQDAVAVTRWGRFESFVDRRDTTDSAELAQSITEHLAENSEQVGLSATPIDTEGMAYIDEYNLGDRATFVIDEVPTVDIIREVKIELSPERSEKVTPVVSSAGVREVFRLFHHMRSLGRRISNLERR